MTNKRLIICSIFYTSLIISVDCSEGDDDESDDDVRLASESDTFKSVLITDEFSLFSLEVLSFLLSMVSSEFLCQINSISSISH